MTFYIYTSLSLHLALKEIVITFITLHINPGLHSHRWFFAVYFIHAVWKPSSLYCYCSRKDKPSLAFSIMRHWFCFCIRSIRCHLYYVRVSCPSTPIHYHHSILIDCGLTFDLQHTSPKQDSSGGLRTRVWWILKWGWLGWVVQCLPSSKEPTTEYIHITYLP